MADNSKLSTLGPEQNFTRSTTAQTAQSPFLDLTAVNDGLQQISANPFWGDSPGSWDTVIIKGLRFPGIARVSGKVAIRKDRRKVPGAHGAKQTFLGYEPAEVSIELRMWTADHWENFQRLAQDVRPKPNQKAPQAFDISHPALAVYGIKAVEFLDAGFPEPAEACDIFKVTLKAIEFMDPATAAKAKVNTNTSSQSIASIPTALGERVDADPSQVARRKPSETNAGPNFTPARP